MSYSAERNAQIVVSLLKQHGIRHVVASPGTTNIPVVVTIQSDPAFIVHSCVDERSAAYMACGIAATSGEPVAISCTGATASRDYMPGLTEAYYRKLPVIALTSFNGNRKIGQLVPQNLDRNVLPNDVAKKSVQIPVVATDDDAVYCSRIVNDAILESTRHGGGPVHLNIETSYDPTFLPGTVPSCRFIQRYGAEDQFPALDVDKKIAVFIGAHRPFSKQSDKAIRDFTEKYNATIFCDHTSNYSGRAKLLSTLATDNTRAADSDLKPNLIITIGEVSGDYPTAGFLDATNAESWRVSLDGEIRDRFNTLTKVFECSEQYFFRLYADRVVDGKKAKVASYYGKWVEKDKCLRSLIPELPFSERWIAQRTAPQIPAHSVMHFAILNSLRSWNYFTLDDSIRSFCNTGGFGIDGPISTVFGSALAEPETLHFLVTGDLAFFYDMNILGNRDLMRNLRILLVNNGLGDEMLMSYSIGSKVGRKNVSSYICADGHFRSHTDQTAAQSWATTMGLKYMSATTKQQFDANIATFLDTNTEGPILFECITNPDVDVKAGEILTHLDPSIKREQEIKGVIKSILPQTVVKTIKKMRG